MKRLSENRFKDICTGCILVAMVLSIAVFIVLLYTKRSILAEASEGEAYVVINTLPAGTVLTKDNYAVYIAQRAVAEDMIPDTAVRYADILEGKAAKFDIPKGIVVTESMFDMPDEVADGMRTPVVVGLKADELYQLDNGILRSGDRIHIYASDEEGNVRLKWSDIYVVQTFDESGKAIDVSNTYTSAQRINLYMEKSAVEQFYTELESGSLRAAKVVAN